MDRNEAAFVFENIWSLWPNKKDKIPSQKAFEYAVSEKKWFTVRELQGCIDLFVKQEPPFSRENKVLGNWIRNNEYQKYLEIVRSPDYGNAIQKLRDDKELAIEICHEWNKVRRGWWTEVVDIEGRARQVQLALEDDFFRERWKDGLNDLRQLFKHRRKESDYLEKLTPSIQWFCNREHNVLAKILEGEYGKPVRVKQFEPDYDTDDLKPLDQHAEDIFSIVMLSFKEPMIRQDVSRNVYVNGELTVETVDWYVIQSVNGFCLKYKGTKIIEKKVTVYEGSLMTEQAKCIVTELKVQAKRYNEEGYTPDLQKQKEVDECPI